MNGLEKTRLKKALENGEITKEMIKKDIFITELLKIIKNLGLEKKIIKEIK